MAWEYDSTGGVASVYTQQDRHRRLVLWVLLAVLLGSAATLIVRHTYEPLISSPQQANTIPGRPAPSPISASPAVFPPVLEGAIVQLTTATFTIPLSDSPPQLSAGSVPLVAPSATRWRLIIPARQSAYYDLGVVLDTPLATTPQAGQVYLWYRSDETATALPDPTVSLVAQADHLIITVDGPELQQMFADRPPVVTVEASTGVALRTLAVSYSDT